PGDNPSARIPLHPQRPRAVTLDVALADAAEALAPARKVLEAQIDPASLRVAVDGHGRQIDDGVPGGNGRDADARATGDGQPAVALAQNRRTDAHYSAGHYSVRIEVRLDAAFHLRGIDGANGPDVARPRRLANQMCLGQQLGQLRRAEVSQRDGGNLAALLRLEAAHLAHGALAHDTPAVALLGA